MNQLIRHFWENNREEVVSKSLMNCHAEGLHSIMLLDSPGKTIRLFITTPEHSLWKNMYGYDGVHHFLPEEMSIGFHAHHCDLTLYCVRGSFINWQVRESDQGFAIQKYQFQSFIKTGEISFIDKEITQVYTSQKTRLYNGDSVRMEANKIHTVIVDRGKESAWLVFEGKEDPNYIPYVYSPKNPNISTSNLYKKMNEEQIKKLLLSQNLI